MGDRIYNFIHNCLSKVLTNRASPFIEINHDKPGFFSSFSQTKKIFQDYLRGKIGDLKDAIIGENGGKHVLRKEAKI